MAQLIKKWEEIKNALRKASTVFNAGEFISQKFTTFGDSTTQFDISNPSGDTFRYTFDGTGTNPGISATTVPVGIAMYVEGENFNAANNGIFVVTGSGANYFEVTNASGVAESNKTIGTGSIKKSVGVGPLSPTETVLGLGLMDVTSGDDDYASTTAQMPYQVAAGNNFTMDVTVGVAVATMEGFTFDIDSSDSSGLDVTVPGTQFKITKVLSETFVEVEPVLV